MLTKNLIPLFIMILFIFCGCGSDGTTTAGEAAPAQNNAASAATAVPGATTPPATPTTPTPPAEPAQNAEGVWHYTCPSGCSGGGGSATACAGCGTTLVHNALYHGNQPTPPPVGNTTITPSGTPSGLTPSVMLNDPTKGGQLGGQAAPVVAPKAPEPPQNAAGVWHYTCPSGCAGGGGSATACAGCGTTLVHNTAYHQ